MHFSLVFTSLLSLLSTANPLPLSRRTRDPFRLIASRSGSPIHSSAINANGLRFWIGKNTASFCPAFAISHCPAGIHTELLAAGGGAEMASHPLPSLAKKRPSNHHRILLFPAANMSTSSQRAPSPSPAHTRNRKHRKTMAPRPASPSCPAQATHSAYSASTA